MYFLFFLDSVRREAAMALGACAARRVFSRETAGEEEQAYFRLIDDALKYKANRKISNCKPAHTVYLLNKFLSSAQRSVRIYTGRLARSIGAVRAYADPEIAGSAIKFLRKENSSLSIIILGEPDVEPGQPIGSHPLLYAISNADGIRGTVSVFRSNSSDWNEFPFHFTIMDSEAARIEFDGNSTDAVAKFGDAHFGSRLVKIFDGFERSSTLIFCTGDASVPSVDA